MPQSVNKPTKVMRACQRQAVQEAYAAAADRHAADVGRANAALARELAAERAELAAARACPCACEHGASDAVAATLPC